jgi:hypothetical protein
MIKHESEFDPNKQGGAGEVGLGQLKPGTATDMGVTNRNDINENLMGSAAYLRQMLNNPKTEGDYRKALMLYNSGPGGTFKNAAYADSVMGQGTSSPSAGTSRTYGVQAGQDVGGGLRAGGQAAFVPQVSSTPTSNALMPSSAVGPWAWEGNPAAADAEDTWKPSAGDTASRMSQMDRQARLTQALALFGALSKGTKFTPVNYDPFKISRQGESASYMTRIGVGGSGIGVGDTYKPIPVHEYQATPARGTKPTGAA